MTFPSWVQFLPKNLEARGPDGSPFQLWIHGVFIPSSSPMRGCEFAGEKPPSPGTGSKACPDLTVPKPVLSQQPLTLWQRLPVKPWVGPDQIQTRGLKPEGGGAERMTCAVNQMVQSEGG